MHHLLPPLPLFAAFIAASVALALFPGPGVLFIVTRSLEQGRTAGLVSAAGVALGNLVNVVAASCGLAALFAASSSAFVSIRLVGALYLVVLGLMTLLTRAQTPKASDSVPPTDRRWTFAGGALVGIFNPKTTLFFGAFLPQFLGPGRHGLESTLLLGMVCVLIIAISDACYACAASMVGPWMARRSSLTQAVRRLCGVTYLGLGIAAIWSGFRSDRIH